MGKINFIGVPLEDTVSFRPGTRFAPDVLRNVSKFIEHSSSRGVTLNPENIADCGNVILLQGAIDRNLSRIRKVASLLLDMCQVLVAIGGEHTLTLALAGTLAERGRVLLIVFDSHLDSRDEWPVGQKVSHATFLRRLVETHTNIKVLHVGSHAFDKEEIDFLRGHSNRVVIVHLDETHTGKICKLARELAKDVDYVYLTVDIDVLSPAYMPATSNPEGAGLAYDELARCLETISNYLRNKIKIVDIVEYNPLLDQGYTYATVVIKLIIDIVTALS